MDKAKKLHLLWIYGGNLSRLLDAATWLETANELSELGWQVTLITTGSPVINESGPKKIITVPVANIYFFKHLLFHLRLVPVLVHIWSEVDVLLFHSMSAIWLFPLRIIRRIQGRTRPILVMDTRDLHVPDVDLRSKLRVIYESFIFKWAKCWADGQTAITDRMAQLIAIQPEMLLGTWPSGVILDEFTHANEEHQWPIQGDEIKLIYIGALLRERNLDQLCIAVNHANTQGMKFKFNIVGSGDSKEEILEIAERSNGQIILIDPVPRGEIPKFLGQAHVGVLSAFTPSEKIFEASSPIKLFEYMAAGLPILATRITCHTDVLGNGNFVFWAEDSDEQRLLDALRLIWQSRAELGVMGNQAALAARDWTWGESARKLKESLEKGLLNTNESSTKFE
jgi:glycosyltransferase involved in cell wall biosynthesis